MTNEIKKLSPMIERAAATLAKATTAADFLDAKREATVAYDAAKLAARFAKVKDAHDTVVAACHRTQADALVIEAQAQCRLADEYDAAQERGEVQKGGRPKTIPNENSFPTVTDIGLTSKQVHEARQVRDAEKAKPGIIRETLNECLVANKEPTHAAVQRAINTKDRKQPTHVDAGRCLCPMCDDQHAIPSDLGDRKPSSTDFEDDTFEPSDDVEVPSKVLHNILDTVSNQKVVAEAYRKILKVSPFDREAKKQIVGSIELMIRKWRSVQSILGREST